MGIVGQLSAALIITAIVLSDIVKERKYKLCIESKQVNCYINEQYFHSKKKVVSVI